MFTVEFNFLAFEDFTKIRVVLTLSREYYLLWNRPRKLFLTTRILTLSLNKTKHFLHSLIIHFLIIFAQIDFSQISGLWKHSYHFFLARILNLQFTRIVDDECCRIVTSHRESLRGSPEDSVYPPMQEWMTGLESKNIFDRRKMLANVYEDIVRKMKQAGHLLSDWKKWSVDWRE